MIPSSRTSRSVVAHHGQDSPAIWALLAVRQTRDAISPGPTSGEPQLTSHQVSVSARCRSMKLLAASAAALLHRVACALEVAALARQGH